MLQYKSGYLEIPPLNTQCSSSILVVRSPDTGSPAPPSNNVTYVCFYARRKEKVNLYKIMLNRQKSPIKPLTFIRGVTEPETWRYVKTLPYCLTQTVFTRKTRTCSVKDYLIENIQTANARKKTLGIFGFLITVELLIFFFFLFLSFIQVFLFNEEISQGSCFMGYLVCIHHNT